MQKQEKLNRWFWRWHVIAGLISIPFMLLLSITGIIYLFKANYNDMMYDDIRFVNVPLNDVSSSNILNYDKQLAAVKATTDLHVTQLTLPSDPTQAVAYRLHGSRGDHTRNIVYVDPYSAKVIGQINERDTLMYSVRKLHGELLLSKPGTYTVELVASWFLVLIITGLYIWWPGTRFGQMRLAGFFLIRIRKGKRLFFRDLHAVGGFWLSLFMLIILAGGMPWTDMFGSELKWVQKKTDTGYPKNWNSGQSLISEVQDKSLTLDQMVAIAQGQNMLGQVTISLPMSEEQVFSVSNRSFWLRDQRVSHFDQYTGEVIEAYSWNDVGILMTLRQIFMRLHQGEYGFINWITILCVVCIFTFSTFAGLTSYLMRRPKGRWGIPTIPEGFNIDFRLAAIICILSIVFPMFGGSVLLILIFERLMLFKSIRCVTDG